MTVPVPPLSKVLVELTGTFTEELVHFKGPISVNSYFGANFSSPVGPSGDKHYFWFSNAQQVLNKTTGEFSGKVKDAKVANIQAIANKIQPISLIQEELKMGEIQQNTSKYH
ncbi:hypothetical protein ACX163_22705 [Bacillus cereus]|uniref:hypothetical protein n=1 Tax=Bacillus thuringiensis TaxID=1428 RepID=UPI0018762EC1|nr:hypothetical protein [Bacillus thuringiensis]MBE5091940.1 hypothetical protein [Bacillus thuringiensis]